MNELNSYSFFLRTFVSMYMNSLGIKMFMNRTVHEVLWGFKDPLLTKLHSMKPEVDEYFGLMWKVSLAAGKVLLTLLSLNMTFRGKLKKTPKKVLGYLFSRVTKTTDRRKPVLASFKK